MTTRKNRGQQKTTGNALSRLGRAEEMAQAAEKVSKEIDERILVTAQECLYQYERTHGPVLPLRPSPDLTTEQWSECSAEEMAGYAKAVLMDDVVGRNGPGDDIG